MKRSADSEGSPLRTRLAGLLAALRAAPDAAAEQPVLDLLLALRAARPAAPDAGFEAQALRIELSLLDEDTLQVRADALPALLGATGGAAHLPEAMAMALALRNRRDFSRLARVAEAVCRLDPQAATTRRLYGQALIETGHASAAVDLLQALRRSLPARHPEAVEAQGLLGRAWKQMYFDASDRSSPAAHRALAEAVATYRASYAADPARHTWQGVNLLALLTRARREGFADLAPELDPLTLARQLQAQLLAVPAAARDDWHQPTLAEVTLGLSLASGDLTAVEQQLRGYVGQPGVMAFQVASTLRQFVEVWGLEDLQPGAPGTALHSAADVARARGLVDILRARLLQLPGGRIELPARALRPAVAPGDKARANTSAGAPADGAAAPAAAEAATTPPQGQLEAILGVEGPKTYAWWRAGVDAARSVAVIRQRLGKRLGTGWLVRAGDLGFTPADESLLVTNYHVVNPTGDLRGILPEQTEVLFEADDPGKVYTVDRLIWCSPATQHDCSLLRLVQPPKGIPPLPLLPSLPPLADDAQGRPAPRCYIIGHPGGRELSFSFQDNDIVDHEGPDGGRPPIEGVMRVHYRAPTEGGNSGSPVFDADGWQVIALHHMGSGARSMPRLNGQPSLAGYKANEGLAMLSLVAAIKAFAAGQPAL